MSFFLLGFRVALDPCYGLSTVDQNLNEFAVSKETDILSITFTVHILYLMEILVLLQCEFLVLHESVLDSWRLGALE